MSAMYPVKNFSSKQRVLVISPPYRLSQASLPLGLAYITAILQKAGHPVEVVDMDVHNYPAAEYTKILKEKNYDVLCMGGMITAWNFLKFTAEYVKQIKPHVKIVLGGGVISSTPKSFVSAVPSADIGVIGEGEDRILELMDAFEGGRKLSEVSDIVYREGDQIVHNPPGKDIENLDSIPFPAWEAFDVEHTYARFPSQHSLLRAKRQLSVVTTRGCPYQCTFCYTEKMVRQRSVENVIDEIEELKHRYNIGHIGIADDLFVVRKQRTIKFCEEMIRRKVNITWAAAGRCNLVDKEFLKLMKAAGCIYMGLGIESGSDIVLKGIKKNQTPEQILNAVRAVKEAGITPGGTFIIGLPPETRESIRETVNLYKTINSYRTHVNKFFFATPYPGTALYNEMVKRGRIKDEIAYFEKISQVGDAVDFLINCTEAFTDEELIKTKKEIEQEVFTDFLKKHPWYGWSQLVNQRFFWGKIKNVLVQLKMRGWKETMQFLVTKLKVKLKLMPDPYTRRWAFRSAYVNAQTLLEGRMPTF